eukprot:m.234363 g.234363  ORF g.234363 m.234363 type:complete len:941 (+) comp40109_c0_seq13:64-2886(+)
MPLRLDVKRVLSARSDRVKSTDMHPSEPWMLVSLYNGNVHIWNYETQTIVKSFEVTDLPVRTAVFVARKNWFVTGSDDMTIRVWNYNTLEKVQMFEAHSDYLRCLAVHPTQPFLLSSSDDMLIKLWDWDNKWKCTQIFEGHAHYVMQIVFNPKDSNTFASASLDMSIKVWQLGSSTPNFTLEGHHKGVNCIDYFHGGDKPYIISGDDDKVAKIWDYQNKTCIHTLEGHGQNVSAVRFHPSLPIILTGSEDGTVRIWHANTYRLETTLNYGLERVWTISYLKGGNNIAIGYDEGSIVIKLGREEPAFSMDSNGKILWAKHNEIQQANLKSMGDSEVQDGERLPLAVKDMGACEIYPQMIMHNPNGRFVCVCGDGEYIIYTAMALRNKSYGSAQEFVWASDSSQYAIREGSTSVKIFKNFKEKKSFKPDYGAENIFGGALLGVRASNSLSFYDWDSTELVRRIEINPKNIWWSENGELLCISGDESFFILKYNQEAVSRCFESQRDTLTEDGVENAFDVVHEIEDVIRTGIWVGDCFIYTNAVNRLNYFVGGEIVTVSHLDRVMYLLGYIPRENRLYLGDKEFGVVSYSLQLSVLEYQTAVMRKDFDHADTVLPTVPKEQRTRVAHFLEKQGFKEQAMLVTQDPEHKFELAVQLKDLKTGFTLAKEMDSEHKWKQLADLAVSKYEFALAQKCLLEAHDYGGLLLLASCSGDAEMMGKLAEDARRGGKNNVAFMAYHQLGKVEECLEILVDSKRLPEAAFFARTYLPSEVSRVVQLWREDLKKTNEKAAEALADPMEYENLFPEMKEALMAEKMLKGERNRTGALPARAYSEHEGNIDRDILSELRDALENGSLDLEGRKGSEVGEDDDNDDNEVTSSVEPTVSSPVERPHVSSASPEKEEPPKPKKSSDFDLDLDEDFDENIDTTGISLDDDQFDEDLLGDD